MSRPLQQGRRFSQALWTSDTGTVIRANNGDVGHGVYEAYEVLFDDGKHFDRWTRNHMIPEPLICFLIARAFGRRPVPIVRPKPE